MQHDSAGDGAGRAGGTDTGGRVVRVSADRPGVDRRIRPYSPAIVPALDRVVTTTTDMDNDDRHPGAPDLAALRPGAAPHHRAARRTARRRRVLTAEPRLLADGRRVLVSTFNCGLYLMEWLAASAERAWWRRSREEKTSCAVPVVAGQYYLVTVPAWSAVVSLDVSDPAKPREVSRVALGADDVPHWISARAQPAAPRDHRIRGLKTAW